jgi:uncharacterized protein (DUF952 family)
MTVIFHIAQKADWILAPGAGTYAAASLATEGFIHCSTATQVLATANRLFRARRELVLLHIDAGKVNAEIRYENLEGGAELYPHVYGALAIDCITAAHEFAPRGDGTFEMPLLD